MPRRHTWFVIKSVSRRALAGLRAKPISLQDITKIIRNAIKQADDAGINFEAWFKTYRLCLTDPSIPALTQLVSSIEAYCRKHDLDFDKCLRDAQTH